MLPPLILRGSHEVVPDVHVNEVVRPGALELFRKVGGDAQQDAGRN